MSVDNIGKTVMNAGLSSIEAMEAAIAKQINDAGGVDADGNAIAMSQTDLIKLQQMTSNYTNTISMMTNILKDMSDSDAEIIRNI